MIALLQGTVAEKNTDEAIIDVQGVGYRVFISLLTLEKLPDIGQATRLFIHTNVREDAFHLYGFSSTDEKELFKHLVSVNGIGPKLAIAVLSVLSPAALVAAIVAEDLPALVRIPGIGKKTGLRILMELKDRVSVFSHTPTTGSLPVAFNATSPSPRQSIKSALINLGYKGSDAERALQSLPPETLENIPLGIRAALKVLAK
ncbi:MAG: Holliday junction branch migration protein RuvA [Magnetococcales bacterium]|nr:Holliday junction branch migration protein RuvA [Magnetococcales bacterium]